MKIEMGESLIYSWLKHIKKCQLSQMNFKISQEWESEDHLLDKYQNIMDKSDDIFNNPFKRVKNIKSLLKQAEIDNIGVNFKENKMYAVDVAFHEGGLNYNKKNYSTEDNITKKILRTIFITKIYFNNINDQTIIFASPKIGNTTYLKLEDRFKKIENFLLENKINVSVKLISNNDFLENIINPLLERSDFISDTSELFLRSIQLNNLFSNEKINKKTTVNSNEKERIGKFANRVFKDTINNNILSNDIITNLQDKIYSKENFNMNFPILRKFKDETIDTKKYYSHPIKDGIYLTNDWYERHREYLYKWLLLNEIMTKIE